MNLGSGSSHSVIDLVDKLGRIAGDEIGVVVDPARVRRVDRPQLLADTTKMRTLFGWTPAWPIDDALRMIWHRADPVDFVRPRVVRT